MRNTVKTLQEKHSRKFSISARLQQSVQQIIITQDLKLITSQVVAYDFTSFLKFKKELLFK